MSIKKKTVGESDSVASEHDEMLGFISLCSINRLFVIWQFVYLEWQLIEFFSYHGCMVEND